MTDWTTRIVDRLCELKRDGAEFDAAWRQTIREIPPRGRDRGAPAETLFDPTRDSESSIDFLYRACSDAWRGDRPALRYLGVLLEGDVFPEAPGAKSGHRRTFSAAA